MKHKLVLFIIFLMLLLTSCTSTPSIPPERIYVSTDITYSEPMDQYTFRLNMDATETESAKYFFEASIGRAERDACIEVTEKVLSNQILEGAIPEIYIFSQDRYSFKYISNHKLYCSVQEWKSVEYITDVLLAIYEEAAHYGTAFGYANYLAKSYKWNSYNCKFSIPSDSGIFDLNYLCFDENFATSNDAAVAKGVSCDFADSYINQHGEQAYQQLLSSHSKSSGRPTREYAFSFRLSMVT